MTYAQPTRRLVADERKRHLLKVASRIVGESGVGALTMERLAAEAGVSKALPYRHFGNATKVIAALAEEEWAWIDNETALGLATAKSYEEKVLAGLRPYFDALSSRGPAFPILMVERSPFEPLADLHWQRVREVMAFWTQMAVSDLGIDGATAHTATGIILGASVGAFQMVWLENAEREHVERVFMLIVRASVRDLLRTSGDSSRRRGSRGRGDDSRQREELRRTRQRR
jgi:AcrR family transcriptional regulator